MSLTSTRYLFSKITITLQKRSIELKNLFNYSLEALPLSETGDTLKKTPKSALPHKFEQDVESVSDLTIGCAILMDGMTLVWHIKTTKMTYSQFATVNFYPLAEIQVEFTLYLMFI